MKRLPDIANEISWFWFATISSFTAGFGGMAAIDGGSMFRLFNLLGYVAIGSACAGTMASILAAHSTWRLRKVQALLSAAQTRSSMKESPNQNEMIKWVRAFRWFCSQPNREQLECVVGDLKKDRREMLREARPVWFIRFVIFWKIIGTVVPIVWDGCLRFLNALLPLGRIIAKIKGLP